MERGSRWSKRHNGGDFAGLTAAEKKYPGK
jgi:hypothetical protein